MRTTKLPVTTIAAVWLLHATPAYARAPERAGGASVAGDARGEITALMNQVQQARLKGDARFFQERMTDDYVGVHGDGATETKAQLVAAVSSGALRYERYEMRELGVRVYGDAAVANTLVAVKATEASGKPSAGEFRTTWAWVRRDGGWQCAAFQATKVVR